MNLIKTEGASANYIFFLTPTLQIDIFILVELSYDRVNIITSESNKAKDIEGRSIKSLVKMRNDVHVVT